MLRLRRHIWLALAASQLLGCTQEPLAWRPPNIVLISIDTLRADRLSAYGYARETSPRLADFGERSAVFERAYTHTPHTLAAHASLMTSLYPGRHGVLVRGNSLAQAEVTLAELLTAQGYRSLAFVNALYLAPQFRVDEGFEVYDYANDVTVARDGERTNATILEQLRDATDQPIFLFAHYFDAHSDWKLPYEAPRDYVERFAGAPPADFRPGRTRRFASQEMLQLNRSDRRLSDSEVDYIGKLYDAGVAYTDAQVGALLDSLNELGILEDSIVIITSDHGEEFQDHGQLLHAQIYEELVRIPMLVSFPEMRGTDAPTCKPRNPRLGAGIRQPRRISGLVQLADVMPMLADCLDIAPPARAQGQSFLALLAGGQSQRRHAYFESPMANQRGILRGQWKLIEAKGRPPRLYDLSSDPKEQRDLAAEHPELTVELATELRRYREENARSRSQHGNFEVPLEVERALEALGYASPADPL